MKAVVRLLVTCAGFAFGLLLVAFIEWNINVASWSQGVRLLALYLGGMVAFAANIFHD